VTGEGKGTDGEKMGESIRKMYIVFPRKKEYVINMMVVEGFEETKMGQFGTCLVLYLVGLINLLHALYIKENHRFQYVP